MERNANKVLLTVIGIAVLIVATVGATFAYFSASSGTAAQNIKTGELKVSATSSLADGVSIKPTTWTNASDADDNADIAKVGLSVVTDGTTIATGKYSINLTTTGITLDTSKVGGKLSDVKFALYDTTDLSNAIITSDFGDEAYTEENGNAVNRTIASNISIPVGENTDTYTLYIWIEDTTNDVQDQLQGLTVTAKLTVDAIQ